MLKIFSKLFDYNSREISRMNLLVAQIASHEAQVKKLNNSEFDYHVVCNKICGNAHFNMKIKVVIESEAEYKKWLASKAKTFVKKPAAEEVPAAIADTTQQTAIKLENKQLALK